LIERTGFDCMFVGGFPSPERVTASPTSGLAGFADIAAAVRDIIAASDVPVLVDIDDGYGDVKNAVHTDAGLRAHGRERGVPGRSGLAQALRPHGGKKVVPAEIMEAKIKATMAERLDAETLICVRDRTRAVSWASTRHCGAQSATSKPAPRRSSSKRRKASPSSSAWQRASTCRNSPIRWSAGARRSCRSRNSNSLGFNAICFGLETIMHAAKAMKTVLEDMRAGTFALRDKGMSFEVQIGRAHFGGTASTMSTGFPNPHAASRPRHRSP
jgi:2-methylisocitrate lyase-like PEP mutase family enzyme